MWRLCLTVFLFVRKRCWVLIPFGRVWIWRGCFSEKVAHTRSEWGQPQPADSYSLIFALPLLCPNCRRETHSYYYSDSAGLSRLYSAATALHSEEGLLWCLEALRQTFFESVDPVKMTLSSSYPLIRSVDSAAMPDLPVYLPTGRWSW